MTTDARVEEIRAEEATLNPSKVRFESLAREDDGLTLRATDDPDNGVILGMADAMINLLGDAENYVECEVTTELGASYTMTIQRASHPTPHGLRLQAEAERDRYRDVVDAARAYVQSDIDEYTPDGLGGLYIDLDEAVHALDAESAS